MKIFVVNCGSSSLKYQIIDMSNEEAVCTGLVERIGIDGSRVIHKASHLDGKAEIEVNLDNHDEAISKVLEVIQDGKIGVVKSLDEIAAIGHRVVHGGEKFNSSVIINDEVMDSIYDCIPLAPLHNPANLIGIKSCQKLMPGKINVGVYDTAFHQTMDEKSFIYGIPYELYEKHGIRRYGFHGTSHMYISDECAKMLGKDKKDIKVITCHLGNGASVSAVKGGKSVDTSMGLTPLEGLLMGTRSGDIDPAIVDFIADKEGLCLDDVITLLNKESGVKGISGVSSDFRDIEIAAEKGNKRAQLALDKFALQVKKYIGAYAAEMNGVDAIVFAGGVGENGVEMRDMICGEMEYLGVKMDQEKNNVRGKKAIVSTDDSKVKVMVIPTNEELVIARDTLSLIK